MRIIFGDQRVFVRGHEPALPDGSSERFHCYPNGIYIDGSSIPNPVLQATEWNLVQIAQCNWCIDRWHYTALERRQVYSLLSPRL